MKMKRKQEICSFVLDVAIFFWLPNVDLKIPFPPEGRIDVAYRDNNAQHFIVH